MPRPHNPHSISGTLRRIADKAGIDLRTVRARWERGERDEDELSRPVRTFDCPYNLSQLARESGISKYTVFQRWHNGERDLVRLTRPIEGRTRIINGKSVRKWWATSLLIDRSYEQFYESVRSRKKYAQCTWEDALEHTLERLNRQANS